MFRIKELNGIVTNGSLLKRLVLELDKLSEMITCRSGGSPEREVRCARVYQFNPIAISSSRSKESFSVRGPVQRRR
jgi:hypothetical protein